VAVALASKPDPRNVLDVGCGTGYLLRLLATRRPDVVQLVGIDPAGAMLDVAREHPFDRRIEFAAGAVEELPYPDRTFDLIVTTTSFDHRTDQQAGIAECARVLSPEGRLIIADLFSSLLTPTLVRSRKGKARTKARTARLLTNAGLEVLTWHDISPPSSKPWSPPRALPHRPASDADEATREMSRGGD
jgi:ubiquinone/menaquinone biosynthesis C-methylase UbiE